MQIYRNYTNDYARRGNYGRSCMQTNAGGRTVPAPYLHTETSGRQTCDPLQNMPLAMAYVPWQNWRNLYDIHKGFTRGTIFEELDKPFYGKGGCNR